MTNRRKIALFLLGAAALAAPIAIHKFVQSPGSQIIPPVAAPPAVAGNLPAVTEAPGEIPPPMIKPAAEPQASSEAVTPQSTARPEAPLHTVSVRAGEAPDRVPLGTAGFNTLARFLSAYDRDPARGLSGIQQQLGLDEDTARKFVEFIQTANQELKTALDETRADFCAKRYTTTTIFATARAMQAWNEASDSRRELIVRNAELVIGAEAMQNLAAQIDQTRSSMSYKQLDHEEALTRLGKNPEEVFEGLCDAKEGDSRSRVAM